MTGRSRLAAALAVLLILLVALAILIVPAELAYYWKSGQWHWRERAAAAAKAAAPASDDFRLYRARFAVAKDPAKVRVLVVGGSTTYGFAMSAADAWPARLAAKLEARAPGRYEVVNVGYLGGHLEAFIEDYRAASRRYVPRERWLEGERPAPADRASWGWRDLDPDIVVVTPVVNDTAPDYAFLRRGGDAHSGVRSMEGWLESVPGVRALAISHYLRLVLARLAPAPSSFEPQRAQRLIAESYEANLRRFVELWRPRPVIVLGLPWLFSAGDPPEAVDLAMAAWGVSDRRELMDEMSYFPALEALEAEVRARVRQAAGVSGAEIGRAIKARAFRARLRLYLDAVHVNAEGHEAFAEETLPLVAAGQATIR